jgi:hypothetical protein
MKASIHYEFDLPEDQHDFSTVQRAFETRSTLEEIYQKARTALKYQEDKDFEKVLEEIRSLAFTED